MGKALVDCQSPTPQVRQTHSRMLGACTVSLVRPLRSSGVERIPHGAPAKLSSSFMSVPHRPHRFCDGTCKPASAEIEDSEDHQECSRRHCHIHGRCLCRCHIDTTCGGFLGYSWQDNAQLVHDKLVLVLLPLSVPALVLKG